MNVQVRSSNGITTVPIEAKIMTERKIFIEGEIDHKLACEFVKKIMVLVSEDSKQSIKVFIDSPGGDINAGLLIYDTIQSCKTPIILVCIGRAYSMAAVIFSSGRHGRYMFPNSELMLHEPLLGNRVSGNSSSIKSISDSLIEIKKKINGILSKHTGKSEDEIAQETSYDHYYGPKESIKFGLCDNIIGFDSIMEK